MAQKQHASRDIRRAQFCLTCDLITTIPGLFPQDQQRNGNPETQIRSKSADFPGAKDPEPTDAPPAHPHPPEPYSRFIKAIAFQNRNASPKESMPGGVAEWSIATVLKTVERESVPWVRIPPPPPDIYFHEFDRVAFGGHFVLFFWGIMALMIALGFFRLCLYHFLGWYEMWYASWP